MPDMVESILDDLEDRYKVALGFECPMYFPVRVEPKALLHARKFEHDPPRPFSAGAGPASLVAGLVECAWVFSEIKAERPKTTVTINPVLFRGGKADILIWEAFGSNQSKQSDDLNDNAHTRAAQDAVDAFKGGGKRKLMDNNDRVFSLAAAIACWAGLKLVGPNPRHARPVVYA